jgi:hypothetical protein
MGHCGIFGYTLPVWATAADLVVCYGPLRSMRSYSKNMLRYDFCAMGHSAGFSYALWVIAHGLVQGCGAETIFFRSGSDFQKVSAPAPAPAPNPAPAPT